MIEYKELTQEYIDEIAEIYVRAFNSEPWNDDWTIENNWKKANPNLGVTEQPKFIKEQVTSAINTPSEEFGVKTKNFNIWCDSSAVWIPERYIIKASKKINLFDFKLIFI